MSVSDNRLCRAENSVFVIIDAQDKLLSAMPKGVADRIVERIGVLLTSANTLSVPVIVTEQYPAGLGATTPAISEQLMGETVVIDKTVFSAAQNDRFSEQLKHTGRQQVTLVGMETHICILQTAIELQQQGYQVFVVEDAVSSRVKANQYNALQRLRGVGVTITNVESVIFEWLQDSSRPDFKALAKLIV